MSGSYPTRATLLDFLVSMGAAIRITSVESRNGELAGDLLVTVEVAVPQQLSPAERDAIEALAGAGGESPRRHLGVD